MEDFNSCDYEGLVSPECPHCGSEVLDVANGGDPRCWWDISNIPDGHFKHECESCGESYYIGVIWSPSFTVQPKSYYEECEGDDLDNLEEA